MSQPAAESRWNAATPMARRVPRAAKAGGVGFWHWDQRSGTTVWDEVVERLFGLDPGAFDGTFDAWLEAMHPDDRGAVESAVNRALETHEPYAVEHRVLLPNGAVRWLEGRGDVLLDRRGEVEGMIGCVWDVTNHVQIAREREAALTELEIVLERERIGRERLEFLAAIHQTVAAAEGVDEIVNRVARAAVPRLGEWCVIALVDDRRAEGVRLVVAHSDPAMERYAHELTKRFPFDPNARTGMPNVIRTGEPEFVAELDNRVLEALDTTDEGREIARQLKLGSFIIVPIRRRDRVLGAVQFVNSLDSRRYTPDDVTLAEGVSEAIAAALENRRLTEEIHRDEFRSALDSLLDDVTIATAVRSAEGRIIDFVIEYMNPVSKDGAGRGAAELTGRSVLEMYPNLVGSGLFDQYVDVVEQRRPLVLDRMRYDDRTPEGEPITGWWSLRVVPFRDGYLASSRDDTEVVVQEQRLRAAQQRQERERQTMNVLQASALPEAMPVVDGLDFGVRYEPANEELPVGGDWYDVFAVPGRDAIGVVVADVAGHGTDAAGVMLRARNALRAYAFEGGDPGEVLARANRLLCGDSTDAPFVTCSYGLIEPGRRLVRWACAGHFPPIRRRGDTVASVDCATGLPLGVSAAATYGTTVETTEAGDVLVWFTDGLIERRGEVIDDGIERLVELVAASKRETPQELVDRVVAMLNEHSNQIDDVAVIAVGFG